MLICIPQITTVGEEKAGAGSVMTCYCFITVYKPTKRMYAFVGLSVLFDTTIPAGISFLQMISAVLMPGLRQ